MSFNIVLQSNTSEPERLDKVLTTLATLTGMLRAESSIVDPVFRVAGDLSTFPTLNYVTVDTFGRSYFVREIVAVRAGLFDLICHVDVLSSFKTQIRANTAIIRKSENVWNLYLNDGSLQAYQKPKVITTAFPTGFTEHEYILVVAGG